MKLKKLTQNQKQCQRKLVREIKNAKAQALSYSHGIQHKYIIHATRNIAQLYKQPRFANNYNFLVNRYIQLEHASNLWQLFYLPLLISIVYDIVVQKLWPEVCLCFPYIGQLTELIDESPLAISIQACLALFLLLAIILAIICALWKTLCLMANSVSKNADTIIAENEMNIIKDLLKNSHILEHN